MNPDETSPAPAGLFSYRAAQLYRWLVSQEDFLLLDVRNENDHRQLPVESPYDFNMMNIPYFEFIEDENLALARIPKHRETRIVCAREGSAKFVGEILVRHGYEDVGYLRGGITTWGSLLTSVRVDPGTDNFELHQFIRPGKACLSYGLIYRNEMVVFDPSRNIDYYKNFASIRSAAITKVYETHAHADHLSGSLDMMNLMGLPLSAHERDFHMSPFGYEALTDGDVHQLSGDGPEIRILHTPGHTEGSITFMINGKYLLTGDTLFIVSAGRPDLGGKVDEWSMDLYNTLMNKYMQIDENVVVLPAHYSSWDEATEDLFFADLLGNIRKRNPIFEITDEAAFVEFVKDNMRESPSVYAEIKRINTGLMVVSHEEGDDMDLGKNECAMSHC